MKKVFLAIIISFTSIQSMALQQDSIFYPILQGCMGTTFAYNKMQVRERNDYFYFSLEGGDIMNLEGQGWESDYIKKFRIKKSKCAASEGQRILFCNEHDHTVVTRSHKWEGQAPTKVLIKNLVLNISFVESLASFRGTGYRLELGYKLPQIKNKMKSNSFFSGTREDGCTKK